jgi:HSP20 family protein
LDLHENTEKNLLTATFEFPGFSKDEVELNFQNGKLTVSAETKKSEDRTDTGYTLHERLHGKFSRTLQLPQGVSVRCSFLKISLDACRLTHIVSQEEQIKATMENGILTVTFPKALPELAPKKIIIQTSDKEEYHTDFTH